MDEWAEIERLLMEACTSAGEAIAVCHFEIKDRLARCAETCGRSVTDCRECLLGSMRGKILGALELIEPMQATVAANLTGILGAAGELLAPTMLGEVEPLSPFTRPILTGVDAMPWSTGGRGVAQMSAQVMSQQFGASVQSANVLQPATSLQCPRICDIPDDVQYAEGEQWYVYEWDDLFGNLIVWGVVQVRPPLAINYRADGPYPTMNAAYCAGGKLFWRESGIVVERLRGQTLPVFQATDLVYSGRLNAEMDACTAAEPPPVPPPPVPCPPIPPCPPPPITGWHLWRRCKSVLNQPDCYCTNGCSPIGIGDSWLGQFATQAICAAAALAACSACGTGGTVLDKCGVPNGGDGRWAMDDCSETIIDKLIKHIDCPHPSPISAKDPADYCRQSRLIFALAPSAEE